MLKMSKSITMLLTTAIFLSSCRTDLDNLGNGYKYPENLSVSLNFEVTATLRRPGDIYLWEQFTPKGVLGNKNEGLLLNRSRFIAHDLCYFLCIDI